MSALRRHQFTPQVVRVESPRWKTRNALLAEKEQMREDILRHCAEVAAIKAAQQRQEEFEQELKLRPIRVLEAALAVLETVQ